jgi:aminoglycoside 3-N-acetyltransferase
VTLEQDLIALGLTPGEIVMVHASLRAVGGRAEDLIVALLAVLGEGGTLMAYVDYEPTAEVPDFDPVKSPAAISYGVLPEVIRRWDGAVRSLNPGASMAAIGARAHWLCRDHPLRYGYGPGSPLEKLVTAGGKVLLLGSDLDQVTLLHYAEHVACLPEKRQLKYVVRSGGVDLEIEEFDTSEAVVPAMPARYFEQVIREFLTTGAARTGKVGNACSHLLPAGELVRFAIEKLEREFGAPSKSDYVDRLNRT